LRSGGAFARTGWLSAAEATRAPSRGPAVVAGGRNRSVHRKQNKASEKASWKALERVLCRDDPLRPCAYRQAFAARPETPPTFAVFLAAGILAGLLWVWMAWANNRGSAWARIVATVLLVLSTLLLIFDLLLSRGGVSLSINALDWSAGVGAVVNLWRWETPQYINFGRWR
jgi:hypothetical protein